MWEIILLFALIAAGAWGFVFFIRHKANQSRERHDHP